MIMRPWNAGDKMRQSVGLQARPTNRNGTSYLLWSLAETLTIDSLVPTGYAPSVSNTEKPGTFLLTAASFVAPQIRL